MEAGSCIDQRPQVLIADNERLLPLLQILFKLPVFDFHTDRPVITGIPQRLEKRPPVDIPTSRKSRTMELQWVSQDANLVQPLPVDRYILQVNPEYARGKFLHRSDIVHLLPHHMRRIVVKPEMGAGEVLEHSPPNRGT